ncbi:MAG: pseudouridine synthase [Methylococcales bacterium]
MKPIILFNKPFQVLSQFTDAGGRKTLKDFIDQPGYYACGRLDKDSEGLLLLSNDGKIQHQISHPKHKLSKTYWVQIEGVPDESKLSKLRNGLMLKDGLTRPAIVSTIPSPNIWPRTPAVRYRKTVPDCWLEITIKEGKNRQVRRMTAAIGHPTLRLIRASIGEWQLQNLQPGEWCFA